MMLSGLDFLKSSTKRIGVIGPSLLSLSLIVRTFTGTEDAGGDEILGSSLKSVAAVLFISGFAITLLRVVSETFTTRPAKGLIDGLASGVIAGLLGGFLGYASHDYYIIPGYGFVSADPLWSRLVQAVVFSIPVGGVVGIGLDFFHPNIEFDPKKHIGAIVIGAFAIVAGLGWFVAYYSPINDGLGVTFGDLQLISEVFILTFFAIVAIEKCLKVKDALLSLAVFSVCALSWRLGSYSLMIQNPLQKYYPDQLLPDIPVYKYFSVLDAAEAARRSIWEINSLLLMVSACIGWIMVTYFLLWNLPKILTRTYSGPRGH